MTVTRLTPDDERRISSSTSERVEAAFSYLGSGDAMIDGVATPHQRKKRKFGRSCSKISIALDESRNRLADLEVTLTKVSFAYSHLDKARAVLYLAKAKADLPSPCSRKLPPHAVRPWLRRFCGVSLSATCVGAIVDQLPDYLDANVSTEVLSSAIPISRQTDLELLVLLCRHLSRIDRTMNVRRRSEGTRVRLRPSSAPAAFHKAQAQLLCRDSHEVDEMHTLRRLSVKLLAAALHHNAGAIERLRVMRLPLHLMKMELRSVLQIDLTQREQALLCPLISLRGYIDCSKHEKAEDAMFAFSGKEALVSEDTTLLSGKRLSALLYELMRDGLRCSRTILLATTMVAIRQLSSLGFCNTLINDIRTLSTVVGRAAVSKSTRSSKRASERMVDLRIIAHNTSSAAFKLMSLRASDDTAQIEGALTAHENALRKLCRSYQAKLQKQKKSICPQKRSSMPALVAAAAYGGLFVENEKRVPAGAVSSLRRDLIIAHQELVQREVLNRLSHVHSGIELQRLRCCLEKHMTFAPNLCFKKVEGQYSSPSSNTASRSDAFLFQRRKLRGGCNPLGHDANRDAKRLLATNLATRDQAARKITRAIRCLLFRKIRYRLACARVEWQSRLEHRACVRLASAIQRWLLRKKRHERIALLTADMCQRAETAIGRVLRRYVRRRRAQATIRFNKIRMAIAHKASHASEADRQLAAARAQAAWRAIRVRSLTRELQAAREDVRMIRLLVIRAANLLIADSKQGTSDPLCYVNAHLGDRGSFAPAGMGPSNFVQSRISTMYQNAACLPMRRDSVRKNSLPVQQYVDTTASRATEKHIPAHFPDSTLEAQRRRYGHVQSTMVAGTDLKCKSTASKLQFYLPPTIRARDYFKFEAVPPRFPVYSAKTPCIEETLNPEWNSTFLVPGVDPDSTITLTIVDKDMEGRDDFLGQTIINMAKLRFIDNQSVLKGANHRRYRPEARREAADERKLGPTIADRKQQGSKPVDAILFMSESSALDEQVMPVLDECNCQVNMEQISNAGNDRGTLSMQIWVCPRAISICSYLEERLIRNSLISFWKPSWCALGFGQLLVYNSRGDQKPRSTFDVDHIEFVDVLKENADDAWMTFKVAGAGLHAFRVPDIGYPNRELLLHAWLRRLRRASSRIMTNEYAPSDCSHIQYCNGRHQVSSSQ